MLADFLAPFWEWLFDKTGVFGLVIAGSVPILLILLAVVLIAVAVAVTRAIVKGTKERKQKGLAQRATEHWENDEYEEAINLYLKLGKMRTLTPKEKYIMALICADGAESGWRYTVRDYSESYWLNQAVDEEYPDAMEYAAYKDLMAAENHLQVAKAVRRLHIADEKGSSHAKEHLADYEKWMVSKGANQVYVGLVMGEADIQKVYACELFDKGSRNDEAMEWLRLAGEYGNTDALCLAGARYIMGDGVKQDVKEGERLLTAAARKDHAEACAALGNFYDAGLGGKKDVYKARDWYEKSLKLKENDMVMYRLGLAYQVMFEERAKQLNMDLNVIAEDRFCREYIEKKMKMLRKAAKLGNKDARKTLDEYYDSSEYGRALRILEKIMEEEE